MNKRRIIYIGILFIVTVIVSITYFSYAYLTRVDEQKGKINIVAGTLDYKITSSDLTNNSITLVANEAKEIEIKVKSLNEIASKYQLYTNSVENVEVTYLEDGDNSLGIIDASGEKTIKVVVRNNSDTNKIITFGVQGGLSDNTLTLEENRVAINEGSPLCQVGDVWNFSYTGSSQEFTVNCSGTYKIELWGAQGSGINSTYYGGNGGYTKGNINLNKNNKLYVYVGEYPGAAVYDANAYNGGGSGGSWPSNDVNGTQTIYSGGGATDIRLTGGDWDDFDSLKTRIMIAAAGGGGGYVTGQSLGGTGGPAGGLEGYSGVNYATNYGYAQMYIGTGGTQTKGGNTITGTNTSTTGTFGSGNSGGYYGGAVASRGHGASGGGSSFISGYSGCNAIAESSTSTSIVHTSQANHYSGKVFTNGVMIDGKGCNWSTGTATNCGSNQPQPNGTNATGHTGNGHARITYLGTKTVTFNTNGGTISEPNRVVAYGYEIGSLPTPSKTNKTFFGWYTDSNYTTKVDSTYIISDDITLYARWGTEIDLNLTGRTQGYPSNTASDISTKRSFTMNTYVVGLAYDNYYQPASVFDYSLTNNSVYVKQQSGYGIGLPITLSTGNYIVSGNISTNAPNAIVSIIKYTSDGTSSYNRNNLGDGAEVNIQFNIGSTDAYEALVITGGGAQTEITVSNLKLYKLD